MKKNQKRLITLAIMMATAPAFGATLSEIEENSPISTSQYLTIKDKVNELNAAIGVPGTSTTSPTTTSSTVPTTTTISGPLLPPPGSFPAAPAPAPMPVPTAPNEADLDYYSFYAQAGDVVTLDIDNGYGDASSVDTILTVFDSSYTKLRENDDASSVDAGSTSTRDARIDNFKISKSGIYYVGVSAYPRFFSDGGGVTASSAGKGDYKLVMSGVSPTVQQINIDIKPGSGELAPLNPKSKGKVPVALLSDSKFNALTVNPSTVTFGATGSENSLSKCNTSGEDVDGDGDLDLVCHFDNQAAGFQYGDLEGIVRGKTTAGMAFEGHGLLKIIPVLTK